MVSKEQIAHDLAIVYLNNRFGAEVSGYISDGEGSIETERFPAAHSTRYKRVPTGEKRFGVITKKVAVEDGLQVDSFFESMLDEYFLAFRRFLKIIETGDFGIYPSG